MQSKILYLPVYVYLALVYLIINSSICVCLCVYLCLYLYLCRYLYLCLFRCCACMCIYVCVCGLSCPPYLVLYWYISISHVTYLYIYDMI